MKVMTSRCERTLTPRGETAGPRPGKRKATWKPPQSKNAARENPRGGPERQAPHCVQEPMETPGRHLWGCPRGRRVPCKDRHLGQPRSLTCALHNTSQLSNPRAQSGLRRGRVLAEASCPGSLEETQVSQDTGTRPGCEGFVSLRATQQLGRVGRAAASRRLCRSGATTGQGRPPSPSPTRGVLAGAVRLTGLTPRKDAQGHVSGVHPTRVTSHSSARPFPLSPPHPQSGHIPRPAPLFLQPGPDTRTVGS